MLTRLWMSLPKTVRDGLRPLVRPMMNRLRMPASGALETLRLLTPMASGIPLVRLGGSSDGGYLIPDDLDGIELAFSPGVDVTWSFERDLGERYGIKSIMCDASVDPPPGLSSLQTFERYWLSGRSRGNNISLADWVNRHADPAGGDLLLQMDIEGSEYEVLLAAPQHVLRRFRIIQVEIHSLDVNMSRLFFRRRFSPLLKKLSSDFVCVHVHPNNCCGYWLLEGVPIPRVLEITLLRRDRISAPMTPAQLPNPLDRDCFSGKPTIRLETGWPQRGPAV